MILTLRSYLSHECRWVILGLRVCKKEVYDDTQLLVHLTGWLLRFAPANFQRYFAPFLPCLADSIWRSLYSLLHALHKYLLSSTEICLETNHISMSRGWFIPSLRISVFSLPCSLLYFSYLSCYSLMIGVRVWRTMWCVVFRYHCHSYGWGPGMKQPDINTELLVKQYLVLFRSVAAKWHSNSDTAFIFMLVTNFLVAFSLRFVLHFASILLCTLFLLFLRSQPPNVEVNGVNVLHEILKRPPPTLTNPQAWSDVRNPVRANNRCDIALLSTFIRILLGIWRTPWCATAVSILVVRLLDVLFTQLLDRAFFLLLFYNLAAIINFLLFVVETEWVRCRMPGEGHDSTHYLSRKDTAVATVAFEWVANQFGLFFLAWFLSSAKVTVFHIMFLG